MLRRNHKTDLTHLDARGQAHMVDVSAKPATVRKAVAEASLMLAKKTWLALKAGNVPKGDALAVARIAGIQAAKRTPDLIPLCHPIMIDAVAVEITLPKQGIVHIRAEVITRGPTGVEMEALTAATVAALTIYDMCKALERGVQIGPIRLLAKSGGRSGSWTAEASPQSRRRR